jgi:predicted Rossmann-fold nucleotide-binding protein
MSESGPMGVDEPAVSEELYTSLRLFAGWDPDRPDSAAETFDFRTYAAARRAGKAALRNPPTRPVARARAVHDGTMSWFLGERLAGERVIAVMGGHRMARNSPGYRTVATLAHALSVEGFLMVSGGGPGAMEATHVGARAAGTALGLDGALSMMGADRPQDDADDGTLVFPLHSADELFVGGCWDAIDAEAAARLHRWQAPAFALAARTGLDAGASIGIPTWLYGHEPPTPLATEHAKYFDNSIREDGLLAVATAGVVFAPGQAGTLQEIFQDAAQNYYESVADRFSPMVFLDIDRHWTEHFDVRAILDRLFTPEQCQNVHWADAVDDAVAALVSASPAD